MGIGRVLADKEPAEGGRGGSVLVSTKVALSSVRGGSLKKKSGISGTLLLQFRASHDEMVHGLHSTAIDPPVLAFRFIAHIGSIQRSHCSSIFMSTQSSPFGVLINWIYSRMEGRKTVEEQVKGCGRQHL